jgi:tripartite-type tricarboxylate transporter receptor subunit TctC
LHTAGGVEAWITTPGEFAKAIRDDYAKYAKLVKDVGARVD